MKSRPSATRTLIARGFAGVEDLVYIGLGLLLAACAIALLLAALLRFGSTALSGEAASQIIPLLDRILLILLVVELLYTVQVSFRLHAVTPEPFLLVGLIAAIRRVLLLDGRIRAYGRSARPGAARAGARRALRPDRRDLGVALRPAAAGHDRPYPEALTPAARSLYRPLRHAP